VRVMPSMLAGVEYVVGACPSIVPLRIHLQSCMHEDQLCLGCCSCASVQCSSIDIK
jgi:hypothetical protein